MHNSHTCSRTGFSRRFKAASLAPLLLLTITAAHAERGGEICVFRTERGEMKQVDSRRKVPYKFRDQAQCMAAENNMSADRSSSRVRERPSRNGSANQGSGDNLARPEEIELEGNIREEDISSPIGRIRLRWPRSAETLFGKTPLRAMTDAARTVNRAINSAAFPSYIQKLNLEWQVVFMDSALPTTQIPAYLRNNCHPGWMTPPANIYIVADRVAGGCSGSRSKSSVADSQLTEVLVHELGHAVEYYMLKYSADHDRMRAEGFATWFETFAAGFSSTMNRSELERRNIANAREAVRQSPGSFQFSGSGADYARASMYFTAIQDRVGVDGLINVYLSMVENRIGFFQAIQKELMWDKSRLDSEVMRILK